MTGQQEAHQLVGPSEALAAILNLKIATDTLDVTHFEVSCRTAPDTIEAL